MYEGEFQNGDFHGKGTYYINGGFIYRYGRNGQRSCYAADGIKAYEGEFQKGNFHGKGTYYCQDGTKKYEGYSYSYGI